MSESAVSELEFGAFVAIDWADKEHAWSLQVAGESRRETGKLAQRAEAIEAWVMQLAARFAGRLVAVAVEQARGALVYALGQYPHLVLFPVHPSTSKDYRNAMFPSGSKADPVDADLLLDLLVLHRGRLRALRPDNEQTRELRILVEKRRQLVDERTAQTNRITAHLKLYFPQVLDWFDKLSAPIVKAFLDRWPTLDDLQQAEPQQVRDFFHQHGSRSERRIQERLDEIRQSKALLRDAAIVQPAVLMVGTLLRLVAVLNVGIQQLEKRIDTLAAAHPDYFIFASFPGAGPALTPRLLAAFGSCRERYNSAEEMQAFSGIAPVTVQSGKQKWVHFRWACPKFLRQTFHEYAVQSIQTCQWAREFYDRQKAKGNDHHAAVRSLAFKWIRILFRCWKRREPYQESLYRAACQARAVALTEPPKLAAKASSRPKPTSGKREDSGLKSARDILKSVMTGA